MLGDINYNLIPESYELVLCRPDRTPIAYLQEARNISVHEKFSGTDELEFTISAYVNKDGRIVRNENFDLILEDYLVLVNDSQYFMIIDPEDTGGNKQDYKTVKAFSLEYELTKLLVFDFNYPSRYMYDVLNRIDEDGIPWGMLNYLETLMTWTVDKLSIPANLLVKAPKTFEIANKSIFDVLLDIQKAFVCLFQYDTVNRKIYIKEITDIGQNRGLFISKENYLKSIHKQTKSNDVVTRLRCYGKDKISVLGYNAINTDYIECFDYYKNTKYMSQSMIDALNTYEALIVTKTGNASNPQPNTFYYLLNQKNNLEQQLSDLVYTANVGLADLKTKKMLYQDSQTDALKYGTSVDASLLLEKTNLEAILSQTVIPSSYTPATGDIITFGVYRGQWQDDWQIIGNMACRKFLVINGSIVYLNPEESEFIAWYNTSTFSLELGYYQQAYNYASGNSGWEQFYSLYHPDGEDGTGYSASVYTAMVSNNFDSVKMKRFFLDNPAETPWSQHSYTNNEITTMTNRLSELQTLQEQNYAYWTAKVNEVQALIDAKQIEITNTTNSLTSVNSQIITLQNSLDKSNHFTSEQLSLMSYFTREKVWQDEHYITSEDLYNEGVKQLQKLAQPPVEFSIEAIDFMQLVEYQHDWDKLVLGDLINISYPDLSFDVEVRLIGYTHKSQDNSLSFEFSNKDKLDDPYVYLSDVLKNTINVSTTVTNSKTNWNKAESANNAVTKLLTEAWDTAKNSIIGGRNQNIEWNERGLFLKDTTSPNEQIGMLNNLIAFTNNNWASASLAITPNGIYAPALYSTIMVSEQLDIQNTAGSFSVDANGVTLDGMALTINSGIQSSHLSSEVANTFVKLGQYYNNMRFDATDGLTVTKTDNKVKATLNATEGFKYQTSATGNGTDWKNVLYYDVASAMLVIDGVVRCQDLQDLNGDSMLSGTKIKGDYIEGKGILVRDDNDDITFRIDSSGNVTLRGNLLFTNDVNYIDIIGDKPPIDANNTYSELINNANIKGFYYNPTLNRLEINADFITAGTITANMFATIPKNKLDATTNSLLDNSVQKSTNYNNVIISEANGIQVFDNSNNERVKIGYLGSSQYGLYLKNSSGSIVLSQDSSGNVSMSGKLKKFNDSNDSPYFYIYHALSSYADFYFMKNATTGFILRDSAEFGVNYGLTTRYNGYDCTHVSFSSANTVGVAECWDTWDFTNAIVTGFTPTFA